MQPRREGVGGRAQAAGWRRAVTAEEQEEQAVAGRPMRRSAALEQPLGRLEEVEEGERSGDSSDSDDSGSPSTAGAGGRGKGKAPGWGPPPFPGGRCPGTDSTLARGGKKGKRSTKQWRKGKKWQEGRCSGV